MEYRINHAGMDVLFRTDDIRHAALRQCVLDALKRFYGHFLQNASAQPVALTFRLTDHLDDHFDSSAPDVLISESARLNARQCFFSGHGSSFGYEFADGRLTTVYYSVSWPGNLDNTKNRALSREFISKVEAQVAAMYSRAFLHPLQIVNLQHGGSFLHACAFSLADSAYIVAATPGAGKSSLLLSMAFADDIDAHFISDDFSCVDSHAHAHEIGRAMAIKSHQLQYFPDLKDRLPGMSLMQRLQWFVLKRRGLKRLAAPGDIFPGRIATDKPVRGIIYLTNHAKSTFEHTPMSVADFADLNANMLFSELYLGIEVINRALILPGYRNLPTADSFIAQTRATLTRIFADVPCTLVRVPFRSDPRHALRYLRQHGIIQ